MRIFVVKKSTLIRAAVFVLLVVGAIVYTQVAFGGGAPVASTSEAMPICRVATDEKMVALTFDTAFGDADYTRQILDVLDKESAKATFFVMGLWADQNQEATANMAAMGHEIANHSMNHTRYPDMTANEVLSDASEASDKIFQLTGCDPKVIRMPYGAFNSETVSALENKGYVPVKWSLDSKDWKGGDAKAIADEVLSKVKSGDIIMFQNNMPATPEALPEIILGLREDGYKLVTVSELLLPENSFVDSQGTQRYMQETN
ncbi:MAG: polysaccharide deacetylase family protein [Burkholderiales bacterium]